MSYADFVKEATQYYQSLPYEGNDLYKKYCVSIPLPEKYGTGPDGIDSFVNLITEKTRVKFDAIITDSSAKSLNGMIRIVKAEETDDRVRESKIFRSVESKLAAYVNGHAQYFVLIEMPKGSKEKFDILFANSGSLSVQIIVTLQEGSGLRLSEIYASNSREGSTVSVMHEISAGRSSEMELNALHNENEKTSVLNLCKANAVDGARINANYIYCGGSATKAVGILDSHGHSSRIDVTEFAYGSVSQNFDLNTIILNSTPYSIADLNSGVVLDDASKCMLKGFAKVSEMAKGANSRITERGILLSKDAHIDALPDMAIDYSNEVKATHSAATSPIDEDALFYLTSRGIDEEKARKLFVTAFIAKYISRIDDPVIKEIAMSVMLDKLDTKAFGIISDITPRNIWMGGSNKR